METSTLTLTEFLLARLAEDEAAAQESRPDEHLRERDESRLYAMVQETGYSSVVASSGRVLADVAAKRKAIDYCDPEWSPVIRFLAQPYSDHQDFREEWRA